MARLLIFFILAVVGLFPTLCQGDATRKGGEIWIGAVSQIEPATVGEAPLSQAPTDRISPNLAVRSTKELPTTDPSRVATSEPGRSSGIGDRPREGLIKRWARGVFYDPIVGLFRNMIFAFPLWAALILTLILERLMPAEPNRKILSVSFAHDLMWFFYEPVLHALIVGTYIAVLAKIYKSYFSNLTFSGPAQTPGWFRFVLAILLLDLGYWVQHYLNHRVTFLWQFHKVHHSQRQLNFFTDFRYHPLEYVVRHTFISVPFLFLSIDPPVIAAVAVVKEWYSRFYHGNIRTNLGPVRYLLVTPQSHRVHHSLEARHRDLNFGAIFSFWDFFFGKQYKGFHEYPQTGIDDERFPHEQEINLKSLFLTPWLQMMQRWRRH
jgi:sterol desaturase/sphingolipid hydroxylase (fatty acid hydroxylase superfamily)